VDQATLHRLAVTRIEILTAQFAIRLLLGEEHIDQNEDGMRDGDSRAFGAPSSRQPPMDLYHIRACHASYARF
jgi:hypothetical protein